MNSLFYLTFAFTQKINIFEKLTTRGFLHQTCIIIYICSNIMINTIQKIFETSVTSFGMSTSQTQYHQAQSTAILHNFDAQLLRANIISSRRIFMEIREITHGKNTKLSFFEIFCCRLNNKITKITWRTNFFMKLFIIE